MTQANRNNFFGPLYAAAGAGDLVYQKLRKVPAALGGLSGKATAFYNELVARGTRVVGEKR